MRIICSLSIVTILLTGCGSHADVAPSQNSSLNAVSPSTSSHQGGAMQQALDSWLKEEWTPATKDVPTLTTTQAHDGTVITTKTEASQVTITKTAPDGTVTTTTEAVTVESEDNAPFTLQKYADKWKVYNENKAKMKEGKEQEPSHADSLKNLPVIGK